MSLCFFNLHPSTLLLMQNEYNTVWNQCLDIIKNEVSDQNYTTWFQPIVPLRLDGKVLTIQVPSQFFYEWLEEHYVTLLKKALDRELGAGSKLEYSIIVDNSSSSARNPHAYTINMPTKNAGYNNKNEVGIPLNVNANIHNPFIIPG